MHVPRIEVRTLDETVEALDLGQTPADIVFLSFSDSDLNALARAYDAFPEPKPTLRIASLAALRHPFSVDLYLERVCARAKLVAVRVLGGADYWRYGVDELRALARRSDLKLALLPGDRRRDARLDEASTLASDAVLQIWRYFDEGGPDNMAACLAFLASEIGGAGAVPPPVPVSAFGRFDAACFEAGPDSARALIVFYRSIYLANDLAPIEALARALRDKGFAVTSVFVTSLKDDAALAPLRAFLVGRSFDVVLNATAFSARMDAEEGTALDTLDAPVLQVVLAGVSFDAWRASQRGLGPSDLAMHVALPEIDGRILTRAISFKASNVRDAGTEFATVAHQPLADRVEFIGEIARRWANLRRKPPSDKRLACVLPDYPARGGRTGYAVGLDTPTSAIAICETLRAAGYDVTSGLDAPSLIAALAEGPLEAALTLAEYEAELTSTPADFRQSLFAVWGDPAEDRDAVDGAFRLRFVRLGKLIVVVQPDRGDASSRKGDYHNLNLPPRHAYVAFYFWLTRKENVDAIVQLGAHGTLEWLPGKAVALSEDCAPEVLLGPTPVVYPFIVNNPGEAAQAKRRIGAVTIGHLTPPLIAAGSHGQTLELEALFDEFAEAQALDPRRARAIATLILERGREGGLLKECAADDKPPEEALVALDAWLCDLKEMRVGDGLHVFGRSPESAEGFALPSPVGEGSGVGVQCVATSALVPNPRPAAPGLHLGVVSHLLQEGEGCGERVAACGAAESLGLLRALGGRFVPPGPAGAPARGRLDVLPTGRNLYAIDPRSAPTRNAWEIGRRAAEEICKRYAQDHGEWPKRIVLDLWGSATMRTGGDDLAQAFALIGCRPIWDVASTRVNGFEVLPLAMLGRSRVDVTLRISGLFRDVFPSQIALFAAAVRAVAALEESPDDNPLAGLERESLARIFGAAPGSYGVGLGAPIARGEWADRSELAETYLAATSHAYDGEGEAREAAAEFRTRVAGAEAFVHVQDLPGQDALDADAFAEHEGGFAAAAAETGANPALYHLDSTILGAPKIRTLGQEIARSLRGRAANPRWLQGQMRHGHRGAAEIAQSLDNLYCFAALTDAVQSAQFDLMFDATLGDDVMRGFLVSANRHAASHMAGVFQEAARRGFWLSRRNSSARILASVLRQAA
jgi:cobaltochelatase CobN